MDTVPNFNVRQLNCSKSFEVMCELGVYMCQNNVSVALLQEPYVMLGSVRGLPSGFRVYTSTISRDGIGASAIVINDSNITAILVEEYTSQWGVCVHLKSCSLEMYVVSVYCRFGEDISPYIQYMESVTNAFRNACVIIGADSNTASPVWFSKRVQHRGRLSDNNGAILEDWILNANISVFNQPSEFFTFSGPNGESDIDVTLGNTHCLNRLTVDWSVCGDWGLSDHNLIKIIVRGHESSGEAIPPKVRWNTEGVDWKEYSRDLSRLANAYGLDRFGRECVDTKVELLMGWIRLVNDWNMRRILNKDFKRVAWWTDSLHEKQKHVRRARLKLQRARATGRDVEQAKANFSLLAKEYKSQLRSSKLEHWKRFVRDDSNENPWGRVYKFCRGKRKTADISSIKVNGAFTANWTDSVTALMESFFPAAAVEDSDLRTMMRSKYVNPPPEFDFDEINEAVGKCKLRKAPGLDGIDGELLRRVWATVPDFVTNIFAGCVAENHFPDGWKVGDVIVLLKSPDKIRSDPGSYRPICLLNVLGKVLERMMVKRLKEKLAPGTSAAQFGFTPGKSTEDAWDRVKIRVLNSVRKYVLAILVDFKGAFDNMSWHAVIEDLDEIMCDEILLWLSYLSNRSACVAGNQGSVSRAVTRGCPQGSVSGPALWNMLMNKLLLTLERAGIFDTAFADDLFVVIESDSRAELERLGEEALRIVGCWGQRVHVSVSEQKTECILLKGSLSVARPPCIKMNGRGIRYVRNARWLGIRVGERMSFKPHLQGLHSKLLGLIGPFRRVLRREWGVSKGVFNVLYRGLFVSIMSYGASVWYGSMKLGHMRDLINKCQRVILTACLNVCRTVSTEAMQVLYGQLPWDLECIRRGLLTGIKRGYGIENETVSADQIRELNSEQLKEFITERLTDTWQSRWDNSTKGRITHEFIPNVRFASMCPEFAPGLWLGYLLTGHGSMNGYLHTRALASTAACSCGSPVEDVKHLVGECALYDDLRDLNALGIRIIDGVVNVGCALASRESYDSLNEFAIALFERRRALCE